MDTANSIASLAAPQFNQELALPVITIEEEIDALADKLAAFCFEHLEEDLHVGYGNDVIEMSMDQDSFNEELRVRDSNAIRS